MGYRVEGCRVGYMISVGWRRGGVGWRRGGVGWRGCRMEKRGCRMEDGVYDV